MPQVMEPEVWDTGLPYRVTEEAAQVRIPVPAPVTEHVGTQDFSLTLSPGPGRRDLVPPEVLEYLADQGLEPVRRAAKRAGSSVSVR